MSTVFTSIFPNARNIGFIYCISLSQVVNITAWKVGFNHNKINKIFQYIHDNMYKL
ncbi:hypothetical protein [Clostridium sp. FP1]|uniref:hypothetical protein n=1 Tax=Clostridium sp. FP1 TaxID=2724076 RepID=UPI0013E9317A|nr:hypothetical protein [Clostridium sp. FP1]MBZ9637185.1 hypothetical protein [Clostridium sp. FP1]